jgi:hypothetical protein
MNEPAVGGSRLFSISAGGEFGAGSGSSGLAWARVRRSCRARASRPPPTLTTRRAPPDGVFEAVHLPPRRDRRLDIAAPEGATV